MFWVKIKIEALVIHELTVRALFAHTTALHHRDTVCILNCCQSMSNHQACATRLCSVQSFLNDLLGCVVERRRCLVQQEYSRLTNESACDRHSLFLAAAQLSSFRSHNRLVSLNNNTTFLNYLLTLNSTLLVWFLPRVESRFCFEYSTGLRTRSPPSGRSFYRRHRSWCSRECSYWREWALVRRGRSWSAAIWCWGRECRFRRDRWLPRPRHRIWATEQSLCFYRTLHLENNK